MDTTRTDPSSPDNPSHPNSDHLDSMRVVTDQAGAAVETIAYRPFGESAAGPTTYRFTSQELDAETGLYYYGARYYNPAVARFVSPDPIEMRLEDPQTFNRYAYARNNPVFFNDPSGYSENDPLEVVNPIVETRDAYWSAAADSFGQGGLSGVAGGIANGLHWAFWDVMTGAAVVAQALLEPINAPALQLRGQFTGNSEDFFEGNARTVVLQQTLVFGALFRGGTRAFGVATELESFESSTAVLGARGSAGVAARTTSAEAGLAKQAFWGRAETLPDHFARHGADAGAATAESCAQSATSLLVRSQLNGLPTKIDASGIIRVYDPANSPFGAFNPNGTARTLFSPTRGAAYFAEQPGVPPWHP